MRRPRSSSRNGSSSAPRRGLRSSTPHRMRAETESVKAELRVDAPDGSSPGEQPSPAEALEQERARLERERIECELRGDP